VTLGIRPEAWRIVSNGEPGFPVKVAVVEELGADSYLYGTPQDSAPDLESGVIRQIIARVPGRGALERGETVRLTASAEDVHVFDTVTGDRLTSVR
jgi:multiple sugar transport system ATP-binding protein